VESRVRNDFVSAAHKAREVGCDEKSGLRLH
jgi:hypothetical protein